MSFYQVYLLLTGAECSGTRLYEQHKANDRVEKQKINDTNNHSKSKHTHTCKYTRVYVYYSVYLCVSGHIYVYPHVNIMEAVSGLMKKQRTPTEISGWFFSCSVRRLTDAIKG